MAPATAQLTGNPHDPVPSDEPIRCCDCEYDLRGLPRGGACPECGRSVASSVEHILINDRQTTWVLTLASGSRWVFIGILVTSVAAGLAQLVHVFDSVPVTVVYMLGVASLLPLVVGIWRVTAPRSPDGVDAGDGATVTRGLARYALPLAMAGWPLAAVRVSNHVLYFNTALIVADALTLVGLVCLLLYARTIARRVPDLRLARQTTWCMALMVVAYLVSAVFRQPWNDMLIRHLPAMTVGPTRTDRLLFRIGTEAVLTMILLAVLWVLALLVMYRDRLRKAAAVIERRNQNP
ncbi:MAG: hypothetical protein GC164_14750 [Phycisphaera sp.]|nr:hypothetical protein [Phycisphaera sp.]